MSDINKIIETDFLKKNVFSQSQKEGKFWAFFKIPNFNPWVKKNGFEG